MTRHKTGRRTFCAPDHLWSAFLAKHGERNGSARLRQLIEQDLNDGEDPVADMATGSSDALNTRKKATR
jgi:hypothetical protein